MPTEVGLTFLYLIHFTDKNLLQSLTAHIAEICIKVTTLLQEKHHKSSSIAGHHSHGGLQGWSGSPE